MARFSGLVGFGETIESPSNSGIWVNEITEVSYFGDVVRNVRKLDVNDELNDNISVTNIISIVADQYANDHFFAIKFVEWAGAVWTVTSVEVKRPRLLLSLGKIYNGPRTD
jgi:hypothetical protein